MAYSAEYVALSVVEALRTDSQLAIFLKVDTVPPLRLYFGVRDIPIGFDSVDPDGTKYLGGGQLNGIPALQTLVNGSSAAIDFTLSGIDPATGAKMIDSLPPVRGALVQVGITTLDQYFQPMTKIIPIWTGVASHLKELRSPARAGETQTISISLATVAGENTRSRAAKVLWSDAMQKSLYPTDDFCNGTGRMARGIQPPWPVFD